MSQREDRRKTNSGPVPAGRIAAYAGGSEAARQCCEALRGAATAGAQLGTLQRLRASLRAQTVSEDASALAWLVELYVHPARNVPVVWRRSVLSAVGDAAAACGPEATAAAAAHACDRLAAACAAGPAGAARLAQAAAGAALLEWGAARDLLLAGARPAVFGVLALCAAALAEAEPALPAAADAGGSSAEYRAAADEAGEALKTAIAVFAKLAAAAPPLAYAASVRDAAFAPPVLRACCAVLRCDRVVHRDHVTQAGLCAAALATHTWRADAAAAPEAVAAAARAALAGDGRGPLAQAGPLGAVARLSLCRGLVRTLAAEDLLTADAPLFFDLLLPLITAECDSSVESQTRLYAFVSLQQWLAVAIDLHAAAAHPSPLAPVWAAHSDAAVQRVLSLLLAAWEQPSSRPIASAVLPNFQRLLTLVAAAPGALAAIVARVVKQPFNCKGRYVALSALLQKVGPTSLLAAAGGEALVGSLFAAAAADMSVAGPAVTLLSHLLAALRAAEGDAYSSDLWVPYAADALTSRDARTAHMAASHCLPEALAADPSAAPALLRAVRRTAAAHNGADAAVLWALVSTVRVARRLKIAAGALPNLIAAPAVAGGPPACPGALTTREFRVAATHADPALRLAALTALTANRKTTTFPPPHELQALLDVLPASLKTESADDRQQLVRSLQWLFVRAADTLRAAASGGANKRKKKKAKTEDSAAAAAAAAAAAPAGPAETARVVGFVRALTEALLRNVTLCDARERGVLTLELLNAAAEALLSAKAKAAGVPQAHAEAALAPMLRGADAVEAVLGQLSSSFDRARELSAVLLSRYLPPPTAAAALAQLRRALKLCASPRLREADAGARLVCIVLDTAAMPPSPAAAEGAAPAPAADAAPLTRLAFFTELSDVLEARNARVGALFDRLIGGGGGNGDGAAAAAAEAEADVRLPHGVIAALRIQVQSKAWARLPPPEAAAWSAAVERFVGLCFGAVRVALRIVGGDDAEQTNANAGGNAVDCRGHMCFEAERVQTGAAVKHEEVAGDAERHRRHVVGAWLAAREAVAALAETVAAGAPVAPETVGAAGDVVLDALLRIKHTGALAAAQGAFQGLCATLLAPGGAHPGLCRLPRQWLDGLLEKAESDEPRNRFVMRRSAGFAMAFQAIARAEPRGVPATLLPAMLAALLSIIDDPTARAGGGTGGRWESAVHAINVVRLLFVDGQLIDTAAPFAARAIASAAHGLSHPQWEIRNSSMMLFAAIVERSVAGHKNDDAVSDASRTRGGKTLSPGTLFAAAGGLGTFVRARLEAAAASPTAAADGHSDLFAVLLLLARLRLAASAEAAAADPAAAAEADGGAAAIFDSLPQLVPLVVACRRAPQHLTRVQAASALASVAGDVPGVLANLAASLGSGGVGGGGDFGVFGPATTHNAVHGTLLQMAALLRAAPAAAATEHAVRAAAAPLASAASRCPPVRLAALRVLRTLSCGAAAERECDAIVDAECAAVAAAPAAPGTALLLVHAVKVSALGRARRLLLESGDGAGDGAPLFAGLTHPGHDVRTQTVKAVKKALGEALASAEEEGGAAPTKARVEAVAAQLEVAVRTETHPPNVRRLLRALCRARRLGAGAGGGPGDGALRGWLLARCGEEGDTEALAAAVELLGHVALGGAPADAAAWAALLAGCAAADRTPSVRRAAAASIAASCGLERRAPGDAATALALVEAWFAALKLCQDDDHAVRDTAAAAVCRGARGLAADELPGAELLSLQRGFGRVTQWAVDDARVRDSIVARLCAVVEAAGGAADADADAAAAAAAADDPVFEAEEVGKAEPVVALQLAANALRAVAAAAVPSPAAAAGLAACRARALGRAEAAAVSGDHLELFAAYRAVWACGGGGGGASASALPQAAGTIPEFVAAAAAAALSDVPGPAVAEWLLAGDAASSARDPCRVGVGLVCTARFKPGRASPLASWARWHLGIGFDHLFVFLDEPYDPSGANAADRPAGLDELEAVARERPGAVTVVHRNAATTGHLAQACDRWAAHAPYYATEVQARQTANAEYALSLAAEMGLDWLVHLDADEAFDCADGVESVKPHFAGLGRDGVGVMTYANHEGVPEARDVDDYFKQVSLFRAHHLELPLTAAVRDGMAWWRARSPHGQYMLVYDNGKSAVRVTRRGRGGPCPSAPTNVHDWFCPPKLHRRTALADPRALQLSNLRPCPDHAVLHYVCCGLQWFEDKYSILGDFDSAWFKGRLPIAPSFHLDARDAGKGGSAAEMFDAQVLVDGAGRDRDALLQLLGSGVCVRRGRVAASLGGRVPEAEALAPANAAAPPLAPPANAPPGEGEKAWMLAGIARGFL